MSQNIYNPLVSIIIPVYNGDNYVSEAIDSALAQTYSNKEILVIDDGSTDKTADIARKYTGKIKYFHKKNGGVASALNLGITEAKGTFVSWLSHDDLYQPEKLESQINILNGFPDKEREDKVIYSNYLEMNDKYEIFNRSELETKFSASQLNHPLFSLIKGYVNGCTLLIARKALIDEGLFNEKLFYSQDFDMWKKLFPKKQLIFQAENTIISRKHPNQGGESSNPRKMEEYSNLWIGVVESADMELMKLISGSELAFYEELLRQVRSQRVFRAAHFIEDKIYQYQKQREQTFGYKLKHIADNFFKLFPLYRKYRETRNELRLADERIEKLVLAAAESEAKIKELETRLQKVGK